MGNTSYKTSLFDIAKYRIGDKPYWIALKPIGPTHLIVRPDDQWLNQCDVHPRIFYDRGYAKGAWKFKERLPKLSAEDFDSVMAILTSDLFIEQFEICRINRSQDTGEFLYYDMSDVCLPEKHLFPTISAAKKEKKKIKSLMAKWSEREFDDRV